MAGPWLLEVIALAQSIFLAVRPLLGVYVYRLHDGIDLDCRGQCTHYFGVRTFVNGPGCLAVYFSSIAFANIGLIRREGQKTDDHDNPDGNSQFDKRKAWLFDHMRISLQGTYSV